MDKVLEDLLKIEDDLNAKIDSLYGDFVLLEHIFHWKGNFEAGLRNLEDIAKKVAKSSSHDKKVILKNHRDVRFYFHGLLQIPYILHDHFQKQTRIKNNPTLKAIYTNFSNGEINQLLLAIRHKVVHEVLLDEYVTVVRPVSGKHYLEVTLPQRTFEVLTAPNNRGKGILGSSEDFFVKTFLGTGKGFIYLFTQFEKELNKFEGEFKKEFVSIYGSKFKERRSLLIKRGKVRSKMKKHGMIFVNE